MEYRFEKIMILGGIMKLLGAISEFETAAASANPPADLDQVSVDACAKVSLAKASDVKAVFAPKGGFYKWYNDMLSRTDAFAHRGGIKVTNQLLSNFDSFWDTIPDIFGKAPVSGIEFCAVMSINIQENSGNLNADPEGIGNASHPGLSYAFEAIPHLKSSYNVNSDLANWTAFKLFQDADYLDAHKSKAGYGDVTRNGVDKAWTTAIWPGNFKTDIDDNLNGFIMQADFYKLRGRGVIQTTGRGDYRLITDFILENPDKLQPAAKALSAAWDKMPILQKTTSKLDVVVSRTTNQDWDTAFSDPMILAQALYLDSHAKGHYLDLGRDAKTLNGDTKTPGSLYFMARKINAGQYPATVVPMMVSMIEAMATLAAPSV
jgi:hypothetical protein